MIMSAVDTFFQGVKDNHLPAAVPITTEDGTHHGLATQVREFMHVERAKEMVLSPDPEDRVMAAFYAIRQTRLAIEEAEDPIRPV
jgi:hypothetical protein